MEIFSLFKNETASPINLDWWKPEDDGVQTMPFSAIAIVPESAGYNDTTQSTRLNILHHLLMQQRWVHISMRETWTDDIGTQLKPSATSVITAYPGSIDVHPTISDSNGGYIPTVIDCHSSNCFKRNFCQF